MIKFHADEPEYEQYYFLSNFYNYPLKAKNRQYKPLNIQYEGQLWPTSEHLYQALKYKCETKEEREWREHIRIARSPSIAKYLGHQYRHVQYGWQNRYLDLVDCYKHKVRYAIDVNDPQQKAQIMYVALKAKFQDPELAEKLKATAPLKLAEQTNDDWGIGGLNLLGLVLERVRGEL